MIKQKTLTDLYDEVESAKQHQMLHAIHYFNYNRDCNDSYVPGVQKLDVLSLEFKYDCDIEKVKDVFEHIKNTYWKVVYDVRLISNNRIHIYTVSRNI